MVGTAVVIRIARAMQMTDDPDVRKVHGSAIPRIGGVAIAAATLAMTILVLALDNAVGEAFYKVQAHVIVLLAAALFMFIIGFVDDIRNLRARTKLLAQVIAALAVCAFGVRISSVNISSWFTLDLGWLAWPVTIFWIVGITNAVNLIDGLDGLAAGISAVACGVIAILALYTGQTVMAVLMLALLGSLTGFLYFNFNPAKVFLGDSGSLFLGFLLGSSSVMCAMKSATLVGLALPAVALGIPIFDTLFSILRRILERRSIFAPDRSHIHHRLLDMGLTQRHAVILMYLVTLTAAALGMFMMVTRDAGTIVVFACLAMLLMLVFRLVGSVRLRETLAGLQHNLAVARRGREYKRDFEHSELRIREARSFSAWWRVVCAAAAKMDFAWLALDLTNGNRTPKTLVWRRHDYDPAAHQTIKMVIPMRQHRPGFPLQIEAAIEVNGSLESAGYRAALFSRLIDEHRLEELPRLAGRAAGRSS